MVERTDFEKEITPAISVVIPIYNGANTISDCIKRLQNQTIQNIEIICVDDGSTDNTLALLQNLAGMDRRLIVYHQENSGAGSARNVAIAKAKGEYIAFMDADDWYTDDDVLDCLYRKAKENGAQIAGGSLANVSTDLKDYEKRRFIEEGRIFFSEYQYDYLFFRFIYSRQLLMNHGIKFPKLRCYEDPVFLLRAMIAAEWFYAVPIDVYTYSGTHHGSLDSEKTIDFLKGLTYNMRISSENRLFDLHKRLFERLITTANYYIEKNMISGGAKLLYYTVTANAAIDYDMLEKAGLYIDEDNRCIPVIRNIYGSAEKYMRFRKIFRWI